jgi:formate--tetrahydrofolate ligase
MAPKTVPPAVEIAHQAKMLPIEKIAARLGIPIEFLDHYGKYKAKVSLEFFQQLEKAKPGKLILVSAITPTPAGEGKTTTAIGLADALNRLGKRASICLREPSVGPCFGAKGGGTGGGYAQVMPMEDINLHFTGDFQVISTAHNLLTAMLDNHLHHGNALGINPARIVWKRVMDMNDRALRQIVVGLGGPANAVCHESGFDITAASEVMAVFSLSQSVAELRQRLGRIVVAYTGDEQPVTCAQLKANGAMTVMLHQALKPNLVQSLEGTPAFVHGGPFGNIAHGCNSVLATKLAMRLSDYAVTEAGFGADLGAEKFINIKCRQSGIRPDAVVIVATVRALKMHGGVSKENLKTPNPAAVTRGLANLDKHIENIKFFGLPPIVAINYFVTDTDEETALIRQHCGELDVRAFPCDHWVRGGAGAVELAAEVCKQAGQPNDSFRFVYGDEMTLWNKVRAIAQNMYGADDIVADPKVVKKFRALEDQGFGRLQVCMAKTQYSLSTDPALVGRPKGFSVPIRDVNVSAGAGFVVVLTGDIMTMPGLPKVPSAEFIDINEKGQVVGLF